MYCVERGIFPAARCGFSLWSGAFPAPKSAPDRGEEKVWNRKDSLSASM